MDIRVDCYAGYRGEETPRQLTIGARSISVVAIQDRWLAPDHRYFKIIGEDQGLYIIRHDPFKNVWQLTFFDNGLGRNAQPFMDFRPGDTPVC